MRIIYISALAIIIATTGACQSIDKLISAPPGLTKTDTVCYPSGQLKEKIFYQNNSILRKVTFYESGKPESVMNRDSIWIHGKIILWYENGKKQSEHNYYRGAWDGKGYSWYENGKLESKSECDKGNCEIKEFYENGTLKSLTKTRVMVPYYIERFCENKQLISKEYSGKSFLYVKYYCNGQRALQVQKNENGAFVGPYQSWFENGKLQQSGTYKIHDGFESIKDGVWHYYTDKGVKELEEIYDNGVLKQSKWIN